MAVIKVQQVGPVVDKLAPQDQKMIRVESEVDSRDQRVVHVGPKVVLVKVGLVDCMVVPVDQKQGPAELKVFPERVVLVSQMVAQKSRSKLRNDLMRINRRQINRNTTLIIIKWI